MNTDQKQPVQIPAEIRAYLEDLLYRAGMTNIDSVVKEAMIQELFTELDTFLMTKIIDYLPVEKMDEFTKLLESRPAQQTMQYYLQENLPNAQDVFTVAFGEFRDMYINNVNKAHQSQT